MTVAAAEFLKHIQPATGWRCLFVLPDKRHYWFQNVDTMAEAALLMDSQGKAVFHGCATFNDPGPDTWVPNPKKLGKKKRNWDNDKRTQTNVAGLKAFWIDLDAGAGKPYASAGVAYSTFETWRAAAHLPPAVIVSSGGGVHAYWPLRDALDLGRWLDAATRLRALCGQHGLAIDPSSTIDAARILRPPGTHNRKILDANGKKLADVGGEPRPVKCGPLVGPYDLADLEPLFGKEVMPHRTVGATETRPDNAMPPGLAPLGASLPSDIGIPMSTSLPAHLQGIASPAAFLNIHAEEPSDPEIIARECAQMRDVGEDPAGGWYPITGVLAFCGQAGHDYAVKIATDPRWIPTIEQKLEQWRQRATGPTTCARFGDLNPLGCVGCRHAGHVTSPIQLGRAGALQHPEEPPPPKPAESLLPPIPFPFFWKGGKLYRRGKDGEPPNFVSEHAVHISELQRGERIDGVSAVFRHFEPKQQEWAEFVAPMKDVTGDRGLSFMAHNGVMLGKLCWPLFSDFVTKSCNVLKEQQFYGTRYDQFGWKADGFLWGEDLFHNDGTVHRAYGSREVTNRGKLMAPQGDAAAWSAAVDRLFNQPGMEAHAFIVLAAFAAPLYKFTGAVGGTIAHAQSTDTGQAKSTAMMAGASVWGDVEATQTIQADTIVAKFISFGILCNLPIFYDELRSPDVDVLKDIVLQFTLGRDKQRGSAEGGLRGDALPWSTVMVSASNLSLVDAVRSDGGEKAHAARIFEFPVRLPKEARRADHTALEVTIQANRGSAGEVYVQALLEQRESLQTWITSAIATFERVLGDGPEMRYVVRLLATIAIAGQISRKAGLINFDLPRVIRWAVEMARANQSRVDDDKSCDLASIVGALINDLAPGTLVMQSSFRAGLKGATSPALKTPVGTLTARYEVETKAWECDVRAVRDWMQKNHQPFTDIERQLTAAGVLKNSGKQTTLGRGSVWAASQVRVWEIDGNHEMITAKVEVLVEEESVVVPFRGKA